MTVGAIGGAMPLPPGSEKRSDAERAALGFERMLLVQLTEQLAKTTQSDGESSSAATGAYRDMLPGTMADAIVAGGGIGLAAALTNPVGVPEDAA